MKPEIRSQKEPYVFQKGKIINCTLKNTEEVNPPQVTYTWFLCDSDSNCDENSTTFKKESYSLQLTSQPRATMEYKCMAKNMAGSDSNIIKVINRGSKFKIYLDFKIF